MPGGPVAAAFPDAARAAADLATSAAVADRWEEESACAGMSVGGLAHHLLGQVENAVRLLDAPPATARPIPVLEHYRRAAWVSEDHDGEANTGIREGSDEQARTGPAALATVAAVALAALPRALAPVLAGERLPDGVLVPWQGWSLSAEDFLLTRLMEIVVHSDDLAVSVGVEPPTWSPEVLAPVLGLLAGVAVERHGQDALVRALSRPQRAPSSVSAF